MQKLTDRAINGKLDEIAVEFEPLQFELDHTVPPVAAPLLNPDLLPGKLTQPTPLFTRTSTCDPV